MTLDVCLEAASLRECECFLVQAVIATGEQLSGDEGNVLKVEKLKAEAANRWFRPGSEIMTAREYQSSRPMLGSQV